MKPRFFLLFFGLMFLGLSCADFPKVALVKDEVLLPRTLNLEVLNQIKKGMTSQREIFNLLGKPQEKGLSHTDRGREEFWVYIYDRIHEESFDINERVREVLRITFRDKVVQEWEHTRFLPGTQLAGTKRNKQERFSAITNVVQKENISRKKNIWLKGVITERMETDVSIRRALGFTRGQVFMQSFTLSDGVNSILVFRFYNERQKIKVKPGKTVVVVTGRYSKELFDAPAMIAWDELMGKINITQPWLATFINQRLSNPVYQTALENTARVKTKTTNIDIPPIIPKTDLSAAPSKESVIKTVHDEKVSNSPEIKTSHEPILSIQSVSGNKDKMVTVLVQVHNTPRAIEAFGFKFKFDEKVLEYHEAGSQGLTRDFASLNAHQLSKGTIIVGGYNLKPVPSGSSGTILAITFKVVCSACRNGDTSSMDLFDLKDDIKGWQTQKGTFTFIAYAHNGDVNNDMTITPADALLVFKYYLGMVELSERSLYRGDKNGDGEITPADAHHIFKEYLDNL